MKTKTRFSRTPPLGQHFLNNPTVARALVDAAQILHGDTVLEIGPGTGALTRELCSRGARVIAVEKDAALVEQLRHTFPDVNIIRADVRDITPASLGLSGKKYILAANIPYYITGEIIRAFLTAPTPPQTMALLVQKEVAERIARNKKESILSLSVKAYGVPHFVRKVSAGNFSPPPSVDSAILTITGISKNFFSTIREEDFFRLVRAGFSSKRKKLSSNLAHLVARERIEGAFTVCGLSHNTRAEDVPLATWKKLAETVGATT